jgi:hypothetical protein
LAGQGKNAFPKRTYFPTQIADFGLKYCILRINAKNTTTGRTKRVHPRNIGGKEARPLFLPFFRKIQQNLMVGS